MKALTNCTIENATLTVYVETFDFEPNNGFISYFINGIQINEWEKIKPLYQQIFTALADDLCKGYCLTKYSY